MKSLKARYLTNLLLEGEEGVVDKVFYRSLWAIAIGTGFAYNFMYQDLPEIMLIFRILGSLITGFSVGAIVCMLTREYLLRAYRYAQNTIYFSSEPQDLD